MPIQLFITSTYDSSSERVSISTLNVLTNAFISIIFRQHKAFVTGTIEATISIYTGPIWTISIVYLALIDVYDERKGKEKRKEMSEDENYKASVINFPLEYLFLLCYLFNKIFLLKAKWWRWYSNIASLSNIKIENYCYYIIVWLHKRRGFEVIFSKELKPPTLIAFVAWLHLNLYVW